MSKQPTPKTFYSINGNTQKLDGGAMFGNAPKALWQRWVDVDDLNRIDLVCRAMLVVDGDKTILFETGIGAFFEPKYRDRYGVQESEHILLYSLKEAGFSHEDIDILVLSHMHFDHAGGLLTQWQEGKESELLFPNAEFIIGKEAWERACNPHPRDRASFIPGLTDKLEATGRLHLVDTDSSDLLGPDYHFYVSNGHTPGMLITTIETAEGPVAFAADLIPGAPWMHLPITMGYDRYPESLIDEKRVLLESLKEDNGRVFFTHDPEVALGTVAINEKGKFFAGSPLKSVDKLSL
ncbi:MBL fold metallo-hydrolase [Kangiella sediminilitoris]|uniref:Metallo-beta-lactamase n=1 Tax=Kangiella sediminilitoris TaxID=1144748 RepID=A0A1B3BAT0_9GAMM|nr:MBL fold metallo-hydrolase [Kangiella sediminilitoris]AOE49895.1 metallo-beta-lactamase [Kangiella sediminilitoris]